MRLPEAVSEMLAGTAEAQARNICVPMSIAVVDSEGGLQLFRRMDGALPASTELAVSKAYTAAVLRMPTHKVGELAQPGGVLYGIQHTHDGKIILFGGGYPLSVCGEVVGGIGISGGSVEQDMLVAEPAVRLLENAERWAEEIKAFLPMNGHTAASLPAVKDQLLRAFSALEAEVSEDTAATLTSGVLLALS